MYSIRQRAWAEVFGTAALVLVGPGSVIATLTLAGKAVPAVTEADLLGISFAFGFIITALVYAIGKVSGCHINPAVTFALAVTKRFPWKEVPVYWVAQYAGGIIGAFAIWGVFGANAVTFGMGQTHFATDASTSYYLQEALAGGTTYWAQYIPVYLIPGLVGAALASFAYDYFANPRIIEEPIEEAVTHEEAPARAASA